MYNETKKILKLFVMLFGTYIAIKNISDINISDSGVLKLIAIVGILFLILENYYPTLQLI